MSNTEIAKLETRWRENPHGLTFAPLAEAYRKQHEPERALAVLAEGLARHPDYIPASIVLGRCHLDLADDARAEAAFARVLELDDENVIALKALADISERHGRPADAVPRLHKLLSVDRSNDDARAQLARVEAAASAPAPAAEEPIAEASAPEALSPSDYVWDEPVEASDVPADAGLVVEDNLRPVGEIAPMQDIVIDEPPAIHEHAAGAGPMPGLVGEDFPEHRATVVPMADLAPGTAAIGDHASFRDLDDVREPERVHDEPSRAEPADASAPETASEPIGELERSAEIELTPGGGSEFQLESAADDWAAGALGADRDPELDDLERAESSYELSARASDHGLLDDDFRQAEPERSEDAAPTAEAAEPFTELDEPAESEARAEPDPAAEAAPEPEPAPAFAAHAPPSFGRRASDEEDDAEDEPAPPPLPDDLVVTESMAELFLRQGHRTEALLVYRELYHRNRNDLRLREKVDSLETALAAEEAASPRGRSYAAPERGRSVAAFLSGIFAARPADAPSAWVAAPAPPAPAPAAIEAASESGDAAPTRPASDHLSLSDVFGDTGSPVPPAVAATAGAPATDDGMSFDSFFGEAAGAGARPRGSRDDEDLDQFHAWLQNLKR